MSFGYNSLVVPTAAPAYAPAPTYNTFIAPGYGGYAAPAPQFGGFATTIAPQFRPQPAPQPTAVQQRVQPQVRAVPTPVTRYTRNSYARSRAFYTLQQLGLYGAASKVYFN
eukprot:CAMPEP_0175860464 /NCGR_PEP_ID=MMETSP0107_2-20121207/30829_1 /TAXON_ID=195067 ORGANISM="Goniomonas pacifica, Strain CCMP1869" /NCGR_SAMPLE_ID=MMETSP0107_2 /ASSEMBLY_ACC=CAM_ASM_000203 /LENGTH=110 /DNA_ID=CAMNT_0017177205 /DNA_START=16 /DNA_END=348 /DNA_ORIENTATION=-